MVSKKGKAWIRFFYVKLFALVPSCVLFIKTSLPFAIKSFAIMEVSPNPGGIPFRFLLKGCIPLGYFLILLQGISLGIKSFYNILDLPMNKDISKDNK